MSAPSLDEIARWDVPRLRGAIVVLDAVAGVLPAWRARMEAVGRSLGDADCWYGPAAQSAGAALVDVSVVATAMTTALEESLEHAQRLLGEAEAAQELAERALATAAAVPVVLDGAGRLVGPLPVLPDAGTHGLDADQTAAVLRAQELAEDALATASLAGRAASEAADALSALGVGRSHVPAEFADLAASVPHASASSPVHQLGAYPTEVAQWWAGLSTAARAEAIARTPYLVGGLDGLPAWARDEANRLHLEHVLAEPSAPGHAVAASVAREIASRTAEGEVIQLYQFQPAEGLVALATGDVDTADSVTLLVPGTGADPVEDLDDLVTDAGAVADATRQAAPELAVATIAWLGYRPPSNLVKAASPHYSWSGGRALDTTLNGLAAARTAGGGSRPQTTVLGHSYGTLVIDQAADEAGELAADDLVLLGSPGMDNRAAELEVDGVHEASAPFDLVTAEVDVFGRGIHGWATDSPGFGAEELPTDWRNWHVGYYEDGNPTLTAIGEVGAGKR